ncbi:MAG: hypothetical protein QXD77_02030 [Candidatus Aenigmatarchaeota archaeon]
MRKQKNESVVLGYLVDISRDDRDLAFFDASARDDYQAVLVAEGLDIYLEMDGKRKLIPTSLQEFEDAVYFRGRLSKDPVKLRDFYESMKPVLRRLGKGDAFYIADGEGFLNIYESRNGILKSRIPKGKYRNTLALAKALKEE